MIRYISISLWIYRTFSYCGHWYSTSAKTQKLLLFLMHRFMTPYKFRFKSLVIVINQMYVSVSPSLSNKFDKNWEKRGKEPPLLEYSNNIISMLIKYQVKISSIILEKLFLFPINGSSIARSSVVVIEKHFQLIDDTNRFLLLHVHAFHPRIIAIDVERDRSSDGFRRIIVNHRERNGTKYMRCRHDITD